MTKRGVIPEGVPEIEVPRGVDLSSYLRRVVFDNGRKRPYSYSVGGEGLFGIFGTTVLEVKYLDGTSKILRFPGYRRRDVILTLTELYRIMEN